MRLNKKFPIYINVTKSKIGLNKNIYTYISKPIETITKLCQATMDVTIMSFNQKVSPSESAIRRTKDTENKDG